MYNQFGTNQGTVGNPLGTTDPLSQPPPQPAPETPNPNDPANIPQSVQELGGVGYKLDNLNNGLPIHSLTPLPDTQSMAIPQVDTQQSQGQNPIGSFINDIAQAPGQVLQAVKSIFAPSSGGSFTPGNTEMRTDRNNNLIAAAVSSGSKNQFTQALDQAGIKWSYGDPFGDNPSMSTIKIEGDAMEAARAILSSTNAIQNWYINHTGKKGASVYGVQNNEDFNNLSKEQQNAYIATIYQSEGGSGKLIPS
jgi:hypothetical protein